MDSCQATAVHKVPPPFPTATCGTGPESRHRSYRSARRAAALDHRLIRDFGGSRDHLASLVRPITVEYFKVAEGPVRTGNPDLPPAADATINANCSTTLMDGGSDLLKADDGAGG